MKYTLLVILFAICSTFIYPQVVLTIEGEVIVDTETNASYGYNIPRSQPTMLTFRNNSLTYVNASGYMLQAGDEAPGLNNNNLDGSVITGNKFIWNGTDESSWTHSVFTGYNVDVIIKYNYLSNTPNGIQRKSNGMTDENGVIAYNIINNAKVGIVAKGMNGVKIYNNTFYSEKTPSQTSRGLIDIHTNTDGGLNAASRGAKIFNNIFYTRNKILNINVYETTCLEGFESDYNLFWCEAGEPLFQIGSAVYTFSEWQNLGYDKHSVVIDPHFKNYSDFVPANRLDYGKPLGADLMEGLSVDAEWNLSNPSTTFQNGKWQVGARVYDDPRSKILIWPNPAGSELHVLIPELPLNYHALKIYDSLGHVVFSGSIEERLTRINVPQSITTGVYSIALESPAHDRYVRKVLFVR